MKQNELNLNSPFSPPTLEQVRHEGLKMGLPAIECEKFHSYFEANGWKMGKNKMKCWTAALNNWRLKFEQRYGPDVTAKRAHTVYELTKIIEANQSLAEAIKNRWTFTTATGTHWDNAEKKEEYSRIKKKIHDLTVQLATLA